MLSGKDSVAMKKTSILRKIAIPLLLATLLQPAMFLSVIKCTDLLETSDERACSIFAERVRYRESELAASMLERWSDLESSSQRLDDLYGTTVREGGLTDEQFAKSPDAGESFLRDSADELIRTLRKNQVSGIFLILTGTAGASNQGEDGAVEKEGLCIRDENPAAGYDGTDDLAAERGSAPILADLGISRDSGWEARYRLTGEARYYSVPVSAARRYPQVDTTELGAWCPFHRLSAGEEEVLSYSVPLISDGGTVYAVLGVEITRSYLNKFLPESELGDDAAYALATNDKKQGTYLLIDPGQNDAAEKLLGGAARLTTKKQLTDDCFLAEEGAKDGIVFCPQQLPLNEKSLSGQNASFVLVGLISRARLFALRTRLENWLLIVFLAVLLTEILGILTAARVISVPIIRLSKNLRKLDAFGETELSGTGILEIDQLIESLNSLNRKAVRNQAKLSTILRLTNYPIGAFEADLENRNVYLSEGIFQVLRGIITQNEQKSLSDLDSFLSGAEKIRKCPSEQESLDSMLYDVSSLAHEDRWIRIREVEQEGSVLGVVSDVTEEVLQKRKIEYERDYDPMTRLMNRQAFQTRIDRLFRAEESLGTAAMLIFDVDGLKNVNDKFGHDCGDRYICCIADALRMVEGENVMVSHISGDEFIVFIYGRHNRDAVWKIIRRITEAVEKSVFIFPNGNSRAPWVSGGVAWYPDDATEERRLRRYADFAMYQAKETSRGGVREFDFSSFYHDNLAEYRSELEHMIAAESVNCVLHPIIGAVSCMTAAYEATVFPESDILRTPAEMLAIARAQGKLYQIEQLAWKKALQKFREELPGLAPGSRLFLRSVPNQTLSKEDYRALLSGYADLVGRIVAEIELSECREDARTAVKVQILREQGLELCLILHLDADSWLSESLEHADPRYLLIGMDVIRNIESDSARQNRLSDILKFAAGKGIITVARGVDTWAEFAYLKTAGVQLIQGDLLRNAEERPRTLPALPESEP
jgi:diguanylate cyclase (GGDEF)-like protein